MLEIVQEGQSYQYIFIVCYLNCCIKCHELTILDLLRRLPGSLGDILIYNASIQRFVKLLLPSFQLTEN